jgi:hypothetical protein
MRRLLLFTLVILGTALSGPALSGYAQAATPGAGQVAGCLVEPRSASEVAEIQATPAVAIEPVMIPTGLAVTPIDEETRSAIEMTLRIADSCAASGDIDRLTALYSPWAIQNGVLDSEPVQIKPGTPEATPAAAQPDPEKAGPATVNAGWWTDSTHVVVEISRGSSVRQVRMVTIDGTWLIDSIEHIADEMVDDSTNAGSAATPDFSTALPLPIMQAIADLLLADESSGNVALIIVSAEPVDWPDTFLGCPVEGAAAAQVITPGFRVTVEYGGQTFVVHTDMTGQAVIC